MHSWLAVVALAVGACTRAAPACDEDLRHEAWQAAVSSCARAYARDASPRVGRQLATAYVRTGDLDRAESAIEALLGSAESAAAHLLLGDIAVARRRADLALQHYSLAVAEYTMQGDDHGLARAAYQLAGIAKERGRYSLAVAAQEIARRSAERSGDRRMAMYANIAGAIILRASGDMIASEQAIGSALAAATTPRDRAWVKLTQGLSYLDASLTALARAPLYDVLALTDDPTLVAAAHLNLAALERESGNLDAAREQLRAAEKAGAARFDLDLLAAQIAVDRGEHARAAKLLADLAAGPLHDRWAWVVPLWQGRNEEARGNPAAAERYYRVALEAAEQLRAQAGRLEPHVLVKHREVYERLVGVLARQARWADALLVIARLDATAIARVEPPRDAAYVLDAWRGRDLAVVVRGGDRAWRLDVRDGRVSGVDLGPADALERSAAALLANPDDRALAASLGDALLGTSRGTSPLYVLLAGELGKTPLAALRRGERLAVADRPLIRVLGLTPRRRRARTAAPPIVIGDPRHTLPGAAAEARDVAAALGVAPLLGSAANTAAVEQASGRILHVASHADATPDGSQLVLADGALGAEEIAALPAAPAFVVLASCGSAAARDLGGWGSLASAFIAAGSDIVIATSWTIRDDTATRIVQELYRDGALDDPAAALARAQQALAARGDVPTREWAAFTAIGGPPSR